jgi:hypothetical protein
MRRQERRPAQVQVEPDNGLIVAVGLEALAEAVRLLSW